MKCKNRIYKYSFYILLGIVLILIVPIIIGLYGRDIFNFKISEILSYYGVLISGVITLIGLKITIENGNKTIIEQFNLQNHQRHLQKIENNIEEIVIKILNYGEDVFTIIYEYKENEELFDTESLPKIILRIRTDLNQLKFEYSKLLKKIFLYKKVFRESSSINIISYISKLFNAVEFIINTTEEIINTYNLIYQKCIKCITNIDEEDVELEDVEQCLINIQKELVNTHKKHIEDITIMNENEAIRYVDDNYNNFISGLNKIEY